MYLSKALGENLIPCPSQLLEITCISWLMPFLPSSKYITSISVSVVSHLFPDFDLLLPSYMNLCDYIGPTQIIQDSYNPHLRILNQITPAKSLLYERQHIQRFQELGHGRFCRVVRYSAHHLHS